MGWRLPIACVTDSTAALTVPATGAATLEAAEAAACSGFCLCAPPAGAAAGTGFFSTGGRSVGVEAREKKGLLCWTEGRVTFRRDPEVVLLA
jgi:hypothetical protein